jgi:hypothetical protein
MDELIAYVWSFREASDIPYRIMLRTYMDNNNREKRKWSCNCPSFVNRGRKVCKHLTTLKEEAKDGTLLADRRFDVSDFGKKVLKLV